MIQSTRADSPFCEGVEMRVADFSLTGSGYSEILSRNGRLRDRGRGSESQMTSPWNRHQKGFVRKVSLMVLTLEDWVQEVTQFDQFSLHYRL